MISLRHDMQFAQESTDAKSNHAAILCGTGFKHVFRVFAVVSNGQQEKGGRGRV
jgi:hypothetical protein